MKQESKNKGRIIGIVVIVVAISIVGIMSLITGGRDPMSYIHFKYQSEYAYISDEDFNKCIDDFESVVDIATEYNKGKEDKDYFLYVDYQNAPGVIYQSLEDESISISSQDSESLVRVCDVLSRRGVELDRIRIFNSFVIFELYNQCFAVVYSPDDTKPKTIEWYKDNHLCIRKVQDNWYFITMTS